MTFWKDFGRWRRRWYALVDASGPAKDAELDSTHASLTEIVVIRNKSAAAPNVSLNSHNRFWRGELRVAAAFGIVLQLGVIVFAGFTTYYPTLRFAKDGGAVASYAFPCNAIGTLVLVAGMLVCAHVVESSTKEERYEPRHGREARLVWLQQAKTVSDQVFDSYVVFPKDDRPIITKSSRVEEEKSMGVAGKGNKAPNAQAHTTLLELKAIFGTITTLCGFIVQFIGLRGLHWSASIAQLVAIMFMVALRAWTRRGLAEPPKSARLSSGFELEWFAMTMRDLEKAPWLDTSTTSQVHSIPHWDTVTGADSAIKKEPHPPNDSGVPKPEESHDEIAHKVMRVRRDLGKLADWFGPTSTEAVALATAIELTMDALLRSSPTTTLIWTLKVDCGEATLQSVNFRLEKRNGHWQTHPTEIEALLSLWLYSTETQEDFWNQFDHKQSSDSHDPPNDAWLRNRGSQARRNLQLLGQATDTLLRDLQWWMPPDATSVIEIKESRSGKLEFDNHRTVGFDLRIESPLRKPGRRTLYSLLSQEILGPDSANTDRSKTATESVKSSVDNHGKTKSFFARESYKPLAVLHAQALFTAFISAVAKILRNPIEGVAVLQPDTRSNTMSWQSFTLRNTQLSKLAQDIASTGLGSLEDVYLAMIPPLSIHQRLPEPYRIVELACQEAKRSEKLQNWKEACDAYLWLFETAIKFSKDSLIAIKATAILMEFLRSLIMTIERKKDHQNRTEAIPLEEAKLRIENRLRSVDQETLRSLMRIFKKQCRDWTSGLLRDTVVELGPSASPSPMFNLASIYWNAALGEHDGDGLPLIFERGADVNERDLLDWTPLHYAAARDREATTAAILSHQADTNATDLREWTPLHYACQHGNEVIVQKLLQEGAEPNVRGIDGFSPLHCAVTSGVKSIVLLLIKKGADVDVQDTSGNTPLLWAAYKGAEDIVDCLWHDSNKSLRDHRGMTHLHLSASAGEVKMSVMLVKMYKMDTEVRDRRGRTPLHLSAMNGHDRVARALIGMGATKETVDVDGQTPLHSAALSGYSTVMKALLDMGLNKNARDSNGWTPLHLAAFNGHEAVSTVLLEASAEKEAHIKSKGPLHNGVTALHIAASKNQSSIVRLLLRLGAKKNALDVDLWTPLHYAAVCEHEAIVVMLVNAGANVNAQNARGKTPLHLATAKGSMVLVRSLLNAGAEVDTRDGEGWTPLLCAAFIGNKAIAELLLDSGADMRLVANRGWTPLYAATINGGEIMERFLLEAGADNGE